MFVEVLSYVLSSFSSGTGTYYLPYYLNMLSVLLLIMIIISCLVNNLVYFIIKFIIPSLHLARVDMIFSRSLQR